MYPLSRGKMVNTVESLYFYDHFDSTLNFSACCPYWNLDFLEFFTDLAFFSHYWPGHHTQDIIAELEGWLFDRYQKRPAVFTSYNFGQISNPKYYNKWFYKSHRSHCTNQYNGQQAWSMWYFNVFFLLDSNTSSLEEGTCIWGRYHPCLINMLDIQE